MKAVRYHGPGHIEIVEIPNPSPGPDEVLVELKAACIRNQTDTHAYDGIRNTYPQDPGCPGREGSGVVVAVGEKVKEIAVGDHVVMEGDRMYADFCVRLRTEVAKIKPEVDFTEAAPLALAGSVVAAALRVGDAKGGPVLITGLGAAGLIMVQIARHLGASEILALDVKPDRFDLARELGATTTALSNDRTVLRRFRDVPAAVGIDTSSNPFVVSLLYSMCTHVVTLDTLTETVKIDIPDNRLATLSNGYFTAQERLLGLKQAVRLHESGHLVTKPLVSQVMKLEEYAIAMQKVRRGEVIKMVLTP